MRGGVTRVASHIKHHAIFSTPEDTMYFVSFVSFVGVDIARSLLCPSLPRVPNRRHSSSSRTRDFLGLPILSSDPSERPTRTQLHYSRNVGDLRSTSRESRSWLQLRTPLFSSLDCLDRQRSTYLASPRHRLAPLTNFFHILFFQPSPLDGISMLPHHPALFPLGFTGPFA